MSFQMQITTLISDNDVAEAMSDDDEFAATTIVRIAERVSPDNIEEELGELAESDLLDLHTFALALVRVVEPKLGITK